MGKSRDGAAVGVPYAYGFCLLFACASQIARAGIQPLLLNGILVCKRPVRTHRAIMTKPSKVNARRSQGLYTQRRAMAPTKTLAFHPVHSCRRGASKDQHQTTIKSLKAYLDRSEVQIVFVRLEPDQYRQLDRGVLAFSHA